MRTSFDEFLIETENAGTPNEAAPCVMGARVRLARNLAGTPFPGWADETRRRDAAEKIAAAAERVPELKDAFRFDASTDSPERKFLIEHRLISPDLNGAASGVIISRSRDIALMLNEEDHLRLQVFAPADNLDAAWKKARAIERALAETLDFAFSKKYGFLTTCPTNAGTGLRISEMLHLPGFVSEGQTEKILRSLSAVGLTARGFRGEDTEMTGCVFQVSNEHTLGVSETETLETMRRWTQDIAEQEIRARRRVIRRENERFADRIARAYGTLRFAISLSEAESLELISLLRWACDEEIFPRGTRERLDELSVETGAAHLSRRAAFRGNAKSEIHENLLRARLFRETLSAVKPPDFSNIF